MKPWSWPVTWLMQPTLGLFCITQLSLSPAATPLHKCSTTAFYFLHHHLQGEILPPFPQIQWPLGTHTRLNFPILLVLCVLYIICVVISCTLKIDSERVERTKKSRCCIETLNIFTVPAKVWTKCQVFLPCHISCTKSLGQSATCPRSFQLSRDQGSHPLITLPSQNKKARYSPQSHPDQRKLIKRVHVCLKSAKTT